MVFFNFINGIGRYNGINLPVVIRNFSCLDQISEKKAPLQKYAGAKSLVGKTYYF